MEELQKDIEEISEHFEEDVKSMFHTFKEHDELLSDANNTVLNEKLQWAPDEISIDTFISVMYMKGMYYQGKENRNGARYCAMRMLAMKEILEHKVHKKPRYIDFRQYTFTNSMLSFINKYCDFLDQIYRSIRTKLLVVSLVLMAIAATTLTIFVKLDWVSAAVVSFVICTLNYVIQVRRLPQMFQKSQLRAIEQYVDGELLGFDEVYRRR